MIQLIYVVMINNTPTYSFKNKDHADAEAQVAGGTVEAVFLFPDEKWK